MRTPMWSHSVLDDEIVTVRSSRGIGVGEPLFAGGNNSYD